MKIKRILNFNIRAVKVESLVLFFYTMLTIIEGLAIFHGDTTLATGDTQKIIAYIQLLCSLVSFFLIILFIFVLIFIPNLLSKLFFSYSFLFSLTL